MIVSVHAFASSSLGARTLVARDDTTIITMIVIITLGVTLFHPLFTCQQGPVRNAALLQHETETGPCDLLHLVIDRLTRAALQEDREVGADPPDVSE